MGKPNCLAKSLSLMPLCQSFAKNPYLKGRERPARRARTLFSADPPQPPPLGLVEEPPALAGGLLVDLQEQRGVGARPFAPAPGHDRGRGGEDLAEGGALINTGSVIGNREPEASNWANGPITEPGLMSAA